MKKEILSELVALRQLYEGGYVQQHYVESYFVIFNDEGNGLFEQLTNLKKFKEKELQLVYESFGFANNTPKEYYGLYKEQTALKSTSSVNGKWMVNQVLIDYAYSFIYEKYVNNIENELKALKETSEFVKSQNDIDNFYLYKNVNGKNESNLNEIIDRNKHKPGFEYLLSNMITLYTRDDGKQMFSYQKEMRSAKKS
jgi:hypothetical protein